MLCQVTRAEVSRAVRTAQRDHTPIHLHLAGGADLDGVPHSVAGRTLWLLTPADPYQGLAAVEDLFIELALIQTAEQLQQLRLR